MAKYGKALYGAGELEFDPKMRFLQNYAAKNSEVGDKKQYLITMKKSEKSEANDLDLVSTDLVKKDSATSYTSPYP